MQTNIILAGVGGQGIVSISLVIDLAAVAKGWNFKQAEVHGMSQRGGEVQSHLRLSDRPIHSDLVPRGAGTLVLSVEPLESLRYVEYLAPEGALVSAVEPFVNIRDYPDPEQVLAAIASLSNHTLVAAAPLAREAGSAKAANMVLLGAAVPFLGLEDALLEDAIAQAFVHKGERVRQTNLDAFRFGRAAGEAYRGCLAAGIAAGATRALVGRLSRGALSAEAIPLWRELFAGPSGSELVGVLAAERTGKVRGGPEVPRALLDQGAGARLEDALFAA